MRMPLLTYFVVVGATLVTLLNLSSYALPDIGSPIETSQLVGLPKSVELPPDPRPLMSATNFGAREKEGTGSQLSSAVYAKGTPKRQSARLAKPRQTESKGAVRGNRVAAYSYDMMISIH
jgi:hypothetical protein